MARGQQRNNVLWDVIEDSMESLSIEVWSWTWSEDEEK
jgi:hypothetical protein